MPDDRVAERRRRRRDRGAGWRIRPATGIEQAPPPRPTRLACCRGTRERLARTLVARRVAVAGLARSLVAARLAPGPEPGGAPRHARSCARPSCRCRRAPVPAATPSGNRLVPRRAARWPGPAGSRAAGYEPLRASAGAAGGAAARRDRRRRSAALLVARQPLPRILRGREAQEDRRVGWPADYAVRLTGSSWRHVEPRWGDRLFPGPEFSASEGVCGGRRAHRRNRAR